MVFFFHNFNNFQLFPSYSEFETRTNVREGLNIYENGGGEGKGESRGERKDQRGAYSTFYHYVARRTGRSFMRGYRLTLVRRFSYLILI